MIFDLLLITAVVLIVLVSPWLELRGKTRRDLFAQNCPHKDSDNKPYRNR
jgi:hypothetical protein